MLRYLYQIQKEWSVFTFIKPFIYCSSHMKTIISLLVLVTAFCFTEIPVQAQTQTPQTTALAEELMALLKIDKTMEQSLNQVAKIQEQMLNAQNATPAVKAKQQQLMKTAFDEVKASFGWETIKPMFVEIYASTFNAEELQAMVDFFKSPMGQKWIEKQPQLQAATMQKMQTLMAQMQPKLQEAIQKAIKQSSH